MAIPMGVMTRFLGAIKIGRLYLSHKVGLTALAGGGQAGATQLTRIINRVDTVVTGNDSSKMPPCDPSRGPVIVINNDPADAMQLFASETSGVTFLVNGTSTAGATGISIARGKTYVFFATESVWAGGSLGS